MNLNLLGRGWQRLLSLFCLGLCLVGLMSACNAGPAPQGGSGASQPNVNLTLVSFAVTRDAYSRVIPKFVEKWQQEHQQRVQIKQSYGGSGAQTRAVIDGLEADVVHLALALDTDKIVKAGLIAPDWEKKLPNHGIVSRSVAALVTRTGNPKGIKTWADLAKPGVSVITADPKTSGVARWNFLALWGSVLKTGGNASKAEAFVAQVYKNVPVLARDAREATDTFIKGQGDVLINYENEVLLAQEKGEKFPFTVPDVNISIDNPIAVVDQNVDKHQTRAVAEAFVQYLFTPEAQREFASAGFRPVDATVVKDPAFVQKYPTIKTLFTLKDLGGWDVVQQQFFADGALFDQIRTQKS